MERPCATIFNRLGFITAVSLMANIHGMTDSLALVCRRPKPSVVAHANRAIYGLPEHAVVRQLLSVVQVGTND